MESLQKALADAVKEYAVEGANFTSVLTTSENRNTFAVVDFATDDEGKHFTAVSIIVRMVGENVVIEQDDNDKPLVDALLGAGIPRQQIVLAYEGEAVPEPA